MNHNPVISRLHAHQAVAQQRYAWITACSVCTVQKAATTLQTGAAYRTAAAEGSSLKTTLYRQCTRQYLSELYSATATALTLLVTQGVTGTPTKVMRPAVDEASDRYLAAVAALYPHHTKGRTRWHHWFRRGR